MKKTLSIIALLFIVTFLHACGAGPATQGVSESGVTVSIVSGAVDVGVSQTFTADFDVSMNASTATTSTFFIVPTISSVSESSSAILNKSIIDTTTCNSANAVAATVAQGSTGTCDTSFILTPESSLEYRTGYTLCLTSGIQTCNPGAEGYFDGMMRWFTTADSNTYSVGGTISGLFGTIVLQNNAAADLSITEDGDFTFATEVANGEAYAVTVLTQPDSQTCTVSSGTGTISSVAVTNVSVTCVSSEWAVSTTTAPSKSYFYEVATDSSGNAFVSGYVEGNGEFDFGNGVTVTGQYDGDYNAIVVKYDSNGVALWATTPATAPNNSYFFEIAVDSSGNVYTVGYIEDDSLFNFGTATAPVNVTGQYDSGENAVIVKYNTNGVTQWARVATVAPHVSEFTGITIDSSDGVYAAGYIDDDELFNFGNNVTVTGKFAGGDDKNAVVVKYDTNGNAQWATTPTTAPEKSSFSAVSTDSSGNVYAVGYIYKDDEFNFGNGATVTGQYDGSGDDYNAVIVKYNSSGTAQWARAATTAPSYSRFRAVSVDSSDNIYAVGYLNKDDEFTFAAGVTVIGAYDGGGDDETNAFVVQYDTDGTAQWARAATTAPNTSSFLGTKVDSDDNIYVAGRLENNGEYNFGNSITVSGGYDSDYNALIVKYNTSGEAQWASSTADGGPNRSRFRGISIDSSDNIFTAGYIQGNEEFNFGNSVTVTGNNATEYNATVVKYSGVLTE